MNPEAKQIKFEQEDLPKIMAGVQSGRTRGERCELRVVFAENGGVISVILEAKKIFK